jgi:hypothetical protein
VQRSTPIKLAFPAKGTAQGTPLAEQAPDTCPNLRNVRLVDWRDRRGGGKRPGHSKALSGLAGTAGARRIQGLCLYLPPTPTAAGAGTFVDVTALFGTGAAAGFTASANPVLDGNWALTREVVGTSGCWRADIDGGTAGADIGANTTATFDALRFGGANSGTALGGNGLICMFGTTNDVTCDVKANGIVTANELVAEECTRVGPAIRFENQGLSGLHCWLRSNGANSVTLQITECNTAHANPVAPLATSAAAATTGLAGFLTYTLRLFVDPADGLVTATCSGALTMSVKLNSTQTQLYVSQTRAGVISHPLGGSAAVQGFRYVSRCVLTKFVPATPAIAQDAATPVGNVLDWSGTIAGAAFDIPAGATSRKQVIATGADAVAEVAGPSTNGAATAVPRIDTGNNRWASTAITAGTNRVYVVASTPQATRPSVRFFMSAGNLRANLGISGVITDTDCVGGLWFVSADHKAWFGITRFSRRVGAADANEARLITDMGTLYAQCRLSTGGEVDVFANSFSGGLSGNSGVLMRRDLPTAAVPQLMVWAFDGNAVTLTINGLLMQTITLSKDAGGLYNGAGAAVLNAISANIGFGMTVGAELAGANGSRGFGGYMVPATPSAVDYSQFRAQILEACPGVFTIGDLVADTQTPVVGPGLTGSLPQMTVAFGKWYCTDGLSYTEVDPVTAVSIPWITTAGKGSLPVGAKYICTYRGRVVLAVGTVWYMSRAGDPHDYQYGTSPLSTSAYNGNDANYGGPADVITGLIPFGDDFLLIMCAGSIWRMDGDPGYQGLLTCLTRKTGMLGPRAWCFDEKGNLYFLGGGGGLYVLPRGATEPLNVSEESMATFFDRQDFATNLVQMGYHAFRREVRIYLTNGDGTTNNVHAVYRPSDGAYWLDTIPIRFGPWAVCDGLGTKFYNRSVLLGGADGFLRQPDPRRNDDDADAIDAWIEFGPFQLSDGQEESMATELQAMIGAGSEPLTWYWFTARSPEEVAAQDFPAAVATGTFNTPPEVAFNTPVGLRQAGGAHKLRIRSNTASGTWALEQIVAYLRPTSRRRSSSAQV